MFRRMRPIGGSDWRAGLRQRCVPFLQPGEQPLHVLVARAGEPPNNLGRVFLVGWLAAVGHKEHRLLCVTDRSIVILRANGKSLPQGVMARLPRDVRLGPLGDHHGEWISLTGLGGGMYVHQTSGADVRVADDELGHAPEVLNMEITDWQ